MNGRPLEFPSLVLPPEPPLGANQEAELHLFLGMPAVVRSEQMRRLLKLAERVGRTSAAVLITGESGCGKEMVARAIHHFSLRCACPWIDLNCAALPELLMESEIFGYEKGAFSGAGSTKPGMFELAHTGSLFLDEIGELPPRMQVKLLRVLDGTPYYRLGGTKKVLVDARIIAATNQDLEQAMLGGGFRRDLYYRLGQIRIFVPPLRERREDIVPLARFFLKQQERVLYFSDDSLAALERYDWPGNVRELRNFTVQAAVMADGDVIGPEHLPLPLTPAAPPRSRPATLDDMEREMIYRVMAETGGQQLRTADILGISLRTLGRKLKQYNQAARNV